MLFTKTTESDTRVHPGESKLIIAARTSPLPSPKSLFVRFFTLFVDSGVALKGSCKLRLDQIRMEVQSGTQTADPATISIRDRHAFDADADESLLCVTHC